MRLIDLTQTISPTMSIFPYSQPPRFHTLATCAKEGYAEMELTLNTHQGTHMDAPAHVLRDGWTLDQFPPEHFTGPGAVIDCSALTEAEIPASVLTSLPTSPKPEFVLFYTGWGKKWNTEGYLSQPPVISASLAGQLIQMELKGVGIDCFSIEEMLSLAVPIHKKLLEHRILIIENLINLDQLIGQAFTFHCLPMKIAHSDGAPARAIAICS